MDSPTLTEEEMIEIKKDVMTQMRHYLCKSIRADRHLDFLRSRRILTKEDAEDISCRSTQGKRTGVMLDILSENPQGLDALLDSIRENKSQDFIIVKITDEVQKAKNDKIESLRAGMVVCSSDFYGSAHSVSDVSYSLRTDSTLLFHPDGEQSSASSPVLCAPSLMTGEGLPSSSLPRPGEPGAPPVPEPQEEGVPCTSSGDSNIQPLRSRSLLSHHNVC
ncbi:B-cell lymphoma/leukemia 10 [Gouania willdenowi]|uniref:B-cell lymphoma/leukemia 10 n=1 Tax=Gouania willdenowi TaxID=441366 RepID=UPI00105424F2|nr:B-cell lymphoma/leukemia 10 [Gouania willdenowi]